MGKKENMISVSIDLITTRNILLLVNPNNDIFSSKVTNLSGVTREKIGVISSHKGFNSSSFKHNQSSDCSGIRY